MPVGKILLCLCMNFKSEPPIKRLVSFHLRLWLLSDITLLHMTLFSDIQVNANDARVYIESNDPSVTSWPVTSPYCTNPSDLGTEEYAVLVKDGKRRTFNTITKHILIV